jgi:hypothetical protein
VRVPGTEPVTSSDNVLLYLLDAVPAGGPWQFQSVIPGFRHSLAGGAQTAALDSRLRGNDQMEEAQLRSLWLGIRL